MGQVISEGLDYIGRIDDDGYVYDQSGKCIAHIIDSGYVIEPGGGETFGKIDEDGTVRDASLNVVGRIEADGYVYIHSKRVCKVTSKYIEKITPLAWNGGQPSSYAGRKKPQARNNSSSHSDHLDFFFSPFFIKLIIGVVGGIVAMAKGLGGIEMILACPICVFLLSVFFKIFNQ